MAALTVRSEQADLAKCQGLDLTTLSFIFMALDPSNLIHSLFAFIMSYHRVVKGGRGGFYLPSGGVLENSQCLCSSFYSPRFLDYGGGGSIALVGWL